ncbi:DUF4065 domain-containing protein [Clostridium perfringens]|uniref:Panacea domain-containing protein n=1 Tax=Clostridium perfringens TaxID=1502 RepID=UPI000400076F|nr:type II toxin-antitoxin system antitoxin SocA domain-containing protein [Clostridium perfringens]EHK2406173.1 DUF4065 domain-containing protein [Clostridium perfringens]MDM0793682.1 DUF4065 domain-containing protein [Clostridium perfringens]
MYDVIDIANYIVNVSIEKNEAITNLKLQKILYYTEAAFLVEANKTCFYEDFEHWRHGPVIPEVYSKFRKYLNSKITDKQPITKIDDSDKIIINKVIDSNIGIDAWELVKRTHNEKPWKETDTNEIISKISIKKFFNNEENRNRIYGE